MDQTNYNDAVKKETTGEDHVPLVADTKDAKKNESKAAEPTFRSTITEPSDNSLHRKASQTTKTSTPKETTEQDETMKRKTKVHPNTEHTIRPAWASAKKVPARATVACTSAGPLKKRAPQDETPISWIHIAKLPRHFPLERTIRVIKLDVCPLHQLQTRITSALKAMSIQVKFMDRPASAALLTPENVEMYLALWRPESGANEVIVEVQRRRGDTIIAHQYAIQILNAASGTFDASDFCNDEGSIHYLQATEEKLKMELAREVPDRDIEKESIVAIEIVHGLLSKDRRDARRLGMEGVCILVNPRKTILSASERASRAVLLGDDQFAAGQGLHEILLRVIQNRTIGHNEETMGEYPIDSDAEEYFMDDDEELEGRAPEDKEEMTLLFNLALDALAHALEVATTFDLCASIASSETSVVDSFLAKAIHQTGTDMLETLLHTLQRAHVKPHNAWLAAKCLRYICGESAEAAQRVKQLNGMECVGEAFDVGCASHAKLESECLMLQHVLAVN